MPPKQGMAAKRIVKELGEISKELPEGVRYVWLHGIDVRSGKRVQTEARRLTACSCCRAGLKNEDNLFEVAQYSAYPWYRAD